MKAKYSRYDGFSKLSDFIQDRKKSYIKVCDSLEYIIKYIELNRKIPLGLCSNPI